MVYLWHLAIIGVAVIAFILLFSGCGSLSTANYPLRPLVSNKSLQDSKAPVVYIRRASTIPLQALQARGGVKALGLETAIVGGAVEAIGGVVKAVPKVEQTWSQIRNSNAFSCVEVYVSGLTNAGDIEAVGKILAGLK